MNQIYQTLEFNRVIHTLTEYALTDNAKLELSNLQPFLSESKLKYALRETTEARMIIDEIGAPPLVSLENSKEILTAASIGGCLIPEQLEYMMQLLTAVRRLKEFLCRGKLLNISLPYYEEQLNYLPVIREEIAQKILAGKVDDHASKLLKDVRQEIERIDKKIRDKAETILKNNQQYFSDNFITQRNGRICLPVKKEYKLKITGSVIDKSSTGAAIFIEPSAVAQMYDELVNLKIDEENEEKRILYTLTELIYKEREVFYENIRIIEKLDTIFAKAKLSYDMCAIEPSIITDRRIKIVNGRHPFLEKDSCIPLNFEIGGDINGVIITGPNTGGKTVAIKTVGLLSIMAQCGLHVPCDQGEFTMNNQVLCDIGDGQNIEENLSTFSAHIKNVLEIVNNVTKESLVIMDEIGSGTDPTEGMGIAIAILEEIRKSGCLFLITTHYPEVKSYAFKTKNILNARMAFDRETLQPLYQLEIGEAGESCALYIAKHLGMPISMLRTASMAAYGKDTIEFAEENSTHDRKKSNTTRIEKQKKQINNLTIKESYDIGDSVMIFPDKKIGIVCKKANEKGILQVQLQNKKIWINHKRVKLHVKAKELYPEDYDFSTIFDSVDVRKARHQLNRKHCEDLEIEVEE